MMGEDILHENISWVQVTDNIKAAIGEIGRWDFRRRWITVLPYQIQFPQHAN